MGFIASGVPCDLLPWPQIEPINHLAPYLTDLDLSDAVESFGQLADNILSDGYNRSGSPPSITSSISSSSSSCQSPAISDFSAVSSPAPSDQTYCSVSSYNLFSPASEYHQDEDRDRPRSNKEPSADDRRRNNASAAEKYRKKLKGRQWKLDQQMHKELKRNAQLKREIRSKLSLYREFVSLLAHNTGYNDLDLADLGSKSLSAIMSNLCHPPTDLDDEIYCELSEPLETFRHILAQQQVPNCENSIIS